MAGQIIWNSNTITFPRPPTAWTPITYVTRAETRSADGHKAVHFRSSIWRATVKLEGPLAVSVERDLWNWWSWAMRGEVFAVAYNSTKAANTTLDGAVASATIPLTATTSIAAGDILLLEKADKSYYEIVVVASVDDGVSATATANLVNAFTTGDTCRHFYYMPSCTALDDDCPIKIESESDTNYFSLSVVIEEALA